MATTTEAKPGDVELLDVITTVLADPRTKDMTPVEIAYELLPAIRQRVRSVPAGEAFGWFFSKARD